MKHLVILILLMPLLGCGQDSGGQGQSSGGQSKTLNEQNLSGTWLLTRYDAYHHRVTGDYLYSDIIEETIVIEDDALTGVSYYECWNIAGEGIVAVKSDTHLYLNYSFTAFEAMEEGVLETSVEEGIDHPFQPDLVINRYQRLEKLTDTVNVDKGSIMLNGPIAVSESNTVCVWHMYSDLTSDEIYELTIPYDDDRLAIRLEVNGELTAGVHDYSQFNSGAEIQYFDVTSNATNFWNITGSNTLYPSTAIINVTESSESTIAGTFSFTGQDAGSYSGEFIMDIAP